MNIDYRPAPQFTGRINRRALYVEMADGVLIALDLLLPAELPLQVTVPTVLVQTRYWRAWEFRRGVGWLRSRFEPPLYRFLLQHGYAVVIADVRGTGASSGVQRHPWDPQEISDGSQIIDWIVAQPWSNGRVGAWGISYAGSAAELLAASRHPALTAVIPCYNEFDGYLDLAYPGGIYLRQFLVAWSEFCQALDANQPSALGRVKWLVRGVKPVDSDRDRSQLARNVSEHYANGEVAEILDGVACRDDRDTVTGISPQDFNVHTYRDLVEASGAAVYGWGGWFDANTADVVIKRYMTYSNRQIAVIGPWNHGGVHASNPYAPHWTDPYQVWWAYLRFLDHYLKGLDTGIPAEDHLYYYTIGAERWKSTSVWPPPGSKTVRLYMANGGLLSEPPVLEEHDSYGVDFDVTTGRSNRWHTQMGRGVVDYGNRAAMDSRLLVYDGEPLAEDTELTGYPVISLKLSVDADDAAIFAYLEEVSPTGRVTMLTEGQLRLAHRKTHELNPRFTSFGPYHSFKREDMIPVIPGEVMTVTFCLIPLSVLIRRGHRIRVALAGADKDTFERIPSAGSVTLTLHHGPESHIALPVIR